MACGAPQILVVAKKCRPHLADQTPRLHSPLHDRLPEGHLERFVSDVVHEPDFPAVESGDEDVERPSYGFAGLGVLTVPNP